MVGHLSPAEFAEATGLCPATVRRWLNRGLVKGRRPGGKAGHWWIPQSEVTRVLGHPTPAPLTEADVDRCFANVVDWIKANQSATAS